MKASCKKALFIFIIVVVALGMIIPFMTRLWR